MAFFAFTVTGHVSTDLMSAQEIFIVLSRICVTELYQRQGPSVKLAHFGSQFYFDFSLVLMMSVTSNGFSVPFL